MGTTCASVHIALTGAISDAIEGIVRAYGTLGFEPAKTASPEGSKHVILRRNEGDAFLSVYDSDNAALDTGERKDLALAASKIFKAAAVCTSARRAFALIGLTASRNFTTRTSLKMRHVLTTCTLQSNCLPAAPFQRGRLSSATILIPTTRACCWSIRRAGQCLLGKTYGSHG